MVTNSDFVISRFDALTGETKTVNASFEEIAEIKAMLDEQKQWQIEQEKIEAQNKVKRQALLDRLGITADEARLLLG